MSELRQAAHELVDRLGEEQIRGLLLMLEDEYFTVEEVEEIKSMRQSSEWTDWREVRADV